MVVRGSKPALAGDQERRRNTLLVKRQILRKLPASLRAEAASRMKGKSAKDAYVAVSLFYGCLPARRHTLIEIIRQLARWKEELQQFERIAEQLGISAPWPSNPSLKHKPTPHFQMSTPVFISSDDDGRLRPFFEPALQALIGEKLEDLVHLKECQNKKCKRIFWAGRITEEGCLPRCRDITRKQRKRRRDAEKAAASSEQEPPPALVDQVMSSLRKLCEAAGWKSFVSTDENVDVLADWAHKTEQEVRWVLKFL